MPDKSIIAWRAYLNKSREFNWSLARDGDTSRAKWEALPQNPDDGILVVVLYENWTTDGGIRYRRIMSGSDYYFVASGTGGLIYGESGLGPSLDDVKAKYPDAHIIQGIWESDVTFDTVYDQANMAGDVV